MSSGLYQIRDKNLDTTLDLTRLKPYGDTMNDGKVQTSFTLPVKDDDKGAAAAVMLAQKMGLADPNVALRQKLDENFTFYVVYGSLTHSINYNEIVVQTVTDETMDMHENDEFLKERLGRKMVVIGASTGTDAHTACFFIHVDSFFVDKILFLMDYFKSAFFSHSYFPPN